MAASTPNIHRQDRTSHMQEISILYSNTENTLGNSQTKDENSVRLVSQYDKKLLERKENEQKKSEQKEDAGREKFRKEIEKQENLRERIDNRSFEVDSFLENSANFWSSAEEFVSHEENKSYKKRINELSGGITRLNEKIK